MQRFATQVLKALDALLVEEHPLTGGFDFELIVPPTDHAPIDVKRIVIRRAGRLTGHLWEQLELPLITFGQPLIGLCGTGPVGKRRQLVVIHDVSPIAAPSGFSLRYRLLFKALVPLLSRAAKELVTVSEFSRGEISRLLSLPRERISVIAEGADHMNSILPGSELPKALKGKRFVLAVSSLNPNKNFGRALTAFASADTAGAVLAIAGGANPRVFSSDALQFTAEDPVVWLGYVSDELLKRLYIEADCFVFPSLYEGFGLPPLEALSCGCPVVSSNAASMPEVLGDAAYYFNPLDVTEIAGAIELVLKDASLRASLRERGKGRAAEYKWRDTASGILSRLESLR